MNVCNLAILGLLQIPEYVEQFKQIVKLIDVSLLPDYFQYAKNTKLDSEFRGGFWIHTSARIYYIHSFNLESSF